MLVISIYYSYDSRFVKYARGSFILLKVTCNAELAVRSGGHFTVFTSSPHAYLSRWSPGYPIRI